MMDTVFLPRSHYANWKPIKEPAGAHQQIQLRTGAGVDGDEPQPSLLFPFPHKVHTSWSCLVYSALCIIPTWEKLDEP